MALASKLKTGGSIAGGLLNENARLLAALDGKSVDELLAMIDQIAAADLSSADRDGLERALVSALDRTFPEKQANQQIKHLVEDKRTGDAARAWLATLPPEQAAALAKRLVEQ